ncbi:Tyrosine-protein phosphatase 99A [Danaus plexippus plexippus]|uniref:Tyrosine-protein phosphatase 99A n=1 Tax=Danaus plexippus plexippus TaxID=278856 RepID=A0A212FIK4_DANPL|nr:Tyrosine-protein phosphatase 99A [Danaus plexippus plexippus]
MLSTQHQHSNEPFTPYKIWVRAFYNIPLAGVMSSDLLARLGPQSESLYVLTDVRPPSAPVILNLTCDQQNGILYLQWRQPLEYNNSLDQYVVTLRKIPEQQPRTRLTLFTKKEDIETMISVKVDLSNSTMYEVKIYAVTLSVATPKTLINGSESPPKDVSSESCAVVAARAGIADMEGEAPGAPAALLAAALLAALAAGGAALVYWRCRSRVSKCISAAYNYLEEGGERAARAPLNINKKPHGVPRQIKLEWVVWRRRYIATQGPTPATLDAFWRMIWQHRVCTLVMITNLVERGRRKCDMYWPAGGRGSSAEFGGIHVTLLYEDVRAAYTVRHLRVKSTVAGSESSSESSTASGEGRHVVQYHYTVWPDHGTPRHPLAVLPFVRAAADPATVLVHCSAGVGRTGTYIVIDAQLNQLKLTGTLSPLGFLCRARTQRNHLVQTEEQYVFVHDALLEYVRSGNTEVEFTKAREYLAKLLEPISEEELAVMDLNPIKHKSVNEMNGENDMSSVKSIECSDNIVENGSSQVSIKTDELNSESKSSVDNQEKDGLVNGDDSEGVYDLAPRSTDTYNKKMAAYNSMNEQEKEEMRRVNRAENYALLERMRSLSNRHQLYQGPPPVNLLEKQNQLITRSCVEASVCARAPHNADKNRPGGILPSDSARVMLVPKPGVEGSEYINASWVCGVRRVREYAVCQHTEAPDPWRLLWDHTAQLVLLLHDDEHPECDVFWPTEDEKELFVANFRASFVSKEVYVAHRRSDRTSRTDTPSEPETNGYRRQEGSDCADDERLIPDNNSPVNNTEPSYRFDRTELRLERLSNRDLSARKSIANGDLFSSLSEKKNGPKSPRSPSKMSLKNFKLSSPTKFKFPEWGSRAAGSPPDTAPPPPPITPSLTVEEEAELRRPVYTFEKVKHLPNVPSDRVIEVTNVSVHSLQDDYQLSVKFIKCSGWLKGATTKYSAGRPDDNEYVRAVRHSSGSEREAAIDRLIAPYQDSFALIEFVAGCQMEYKNGPVVVVDKYGGWRALTFCSLSAACGGVRNPDIKEPGSEWASPCVAADLYCSSALNAHARCQASPNSPASQTSQTSQASQSSQTSQERPVTHSPEALLAAYCALTAYATKLPRPDS